LLLGGLLLYRIRLRQVRHQMREQELAELVERRTYELDQANDRLQAQA